jgi:hypothetical protein
MVPTRSLLLVAGACIFPQARALVSLSDDQMTTLLYEGGLSLAMKAQPMFFFGQAEKQPPCYPAFAVVNGQVAHGPRLDVIAVPLALGSVIRGRLSQFITPIKSAMTTRSELPTICFMRRMGMPLYLSDFRVRLGNKVFVLT